MPRVLVTRQIAQEAIDMLRAGAEVKVWEEDRAIPREMLLREVADADALLSLLTEKIDDELLEVGRNLRIVANMAVGFDNFDVPALTRRGIVGTNTPGVLTETTADFAFALMMGAGRYVSQGVEYVRSGKWKTWEPNLFVGQDIHHTTVGIVGMGRIGSEFAKRAHGFDMQVLYYDVFRRDPDFERQHSIEYRELDDLLAQSDYVTIHVDLNESTRKLFNAERLAKMKKTAYLINAARGPIVDTDALYDALKSGQIAGAALDVTDPEPLPSDHPLLQLNNCIVCPHIASASVRTRTNMAKLAAENIVNVLDGKKPVTPVNPEVLNRA
jgi:glyoxylate reductase